MAAGIAKTPASRLQAPGVPQPLRLLEVDRCSFFCASDAMRVPCTMPRLVEARRLPLRRKNERLTRPLRRLDILLGKRLHELIQGGARYQRTASSLADIQSVQH